MHSVVSYYLPQNTSTKCRYMERFNIKRENCGIGLIQQELNNKTTTTIGSEKYFNTTTS